MRHALGLGFGGSTFERLFYVADAQIDWKLPHDALQVCLTQDSLLVFFPLKGEKRYRIVGTFPEEFSKDEDEVLYAEIEQRIQAEAKFELYIRDVEWFSTYKVHSRHVCQFSKGRCFLAGDTEWIDFNIIPIDERAMEVFGTNQSFSVLLRPDNYIAFISTETSPERAKTYFKELVTF